MPSLLDLADETLILIGDFVHGDSSTATRPSLFPLSTPIDGRITVKSSSAVRSTWEDMEKWMSDVPAYMALAVRRIEIAFIEDSVTGNTTASIRWTLTLFLSMFTSLEELVITSLEDENGCDPIDSFAQLKPFHLDFLPSLRSLSVALPCRDCSVQIPYLFVLAAPRLHHLKMYIGIDSHHPLGTPKNIEVWNAIHQTWKKRHAKRELPLQTLFIRMDDTYSPDKLGVFTRSLGNLPHLKKVLTWHHTYTREPNLNPTWKILACPKGKRSREGGRDGVGKVKAKVKDKQEWDFYVHDGLEFDPSNLDREHVIPLYEYAASLAHGNRDLRSFDFNLELVICAPDAPPRRHFHPPMAGRDRKADNRCLMDAMKAASKVFIKTIPSMSIGVFWTASLRWSESTVWNRWIWHVVKQPNGRKKSVVTRETYWNPSDMAAERIHGGQETVQNTGVALPSTDLAQVFHGHAS
ncbi:hypothetical protein IAR55_003983 [Kwoniella newhampshirensis]|uniref:Uncharacterized protein n=1 Tax=Kwoniella newhampshirensis TaxID=1651941 RepID=A0AAW0YXV1_9TREE